VEKEALRSYAARKKKSKDFMDEEVGDSWYGLLILNH
jgi:hypothetical protein